MRHSSKFSTGRIAEETDPASAFEAATPPGGVHRHCQGCRSNVLASVIVEASKGAI